MVECFFLRTKWLWVRIPLLLLLYQLDAAFLWVDSRLQLHLNLMHESVDFLSAETHIFILAERRYHNEIEVLRSFFRAFFFVGRRYSWEYSTLRQTNFFSNSDIWKPLTSWQRKFERIFAYNFLLTRDFSQLRLGAQL